MRIVIITSKKHLYADIVLQRLYRSFGSDVFLVLLQDTVIPGRTKIAGLLQYVRVSGFRYIVSQVVKQLVIQWRYRFTAPPPETKVLSWEALRREGKIRETITASRPDLLISVFSKYYLNRSIRQTARIASLNVHPSLLPAFRGVSPTFWALATGANTSGATIHILADDIDGGTILAQEPVPIKPHDSEHGLYLRCAATAGDLLVRVVAAYRSGKPQPPVQTHANASTYSLPTREAVAQLRQHLHPLFRLSEVWSLRQTKNSDHNQ